MQHHRIAILDFGSQTTQLIARRVRELGVYCEIFAHDVNEEKLAQFAPKALILSGGPSSVYDADAPRLHADILSMQVPVLAICYGMQLLVRMQGGKVAAASKREYGRAELEVCSGALFEKLPQDMTVWMSHGDQVDELPEHFETIAQSATCPHAAVAWPKARVYGVQFHPEVTHTPFGKHILANFLFGIAKVEASWNMGNFLESAVDKIREQVGNERVLMGLSGGVDSTVAAALIHRAIGAQLTCVFVDHGLNRQGELEEIQTLFADFEHFDLRIVDAKKQFLSELCGVADPEQKRKIIGRVFIEVFEQAALAQESVAFLGQGTLYPDVIESTSAQGPSAVIKSHHNVGGLPERMRMKLIEPLRELFKDEVRALGERLGLPEALVWRQPFPGPGLAVRIAGDVTEERLDRVRAADAIVREEVGKLDADVQRSLWQWFAVLLPVRSVGVMGDGRTYGETISIRCVKSTDAMTADVADLPMSSLTKMSSRIINEVLGVSRVLYDISSKPPSTIEWE